jgi:curved DNA-binding protein CbpA
MTKIKYFLLCFTLDEVKKRYKELAMQWHPDKGGDTAVMQDINNEYASIIKDAFYKFSDQSEEDQAEYIKYPEIINKIIGLPGIIIELIGNWIWVSGNTYDHRVVLKQTGFYFAPNKAMWYYRPPEYKSSNRDSKSIEYIRWKYGSEIVDNKQGKFALTN